MENENENKHGKTANRQIYAGQNVLACSVGNLKLCSTRIYHSERKNNVL